MKVFFKKKTVRAQKTVGQILKRYRNQKGITLIQSENETQIRLKYLKALEENDYNIFSAGVYALGFLARYSAYLGVNSQELVERYKNEREIAKNIGAKSLFSLKRESPFSTTDQNVYAHRPSLNLSPQIMVSLAISFCVVCLMGYIWFQVKSFAAAPELELKNPSSEIVVSLDNIKIEGKTDKDAALFINNQVVPVDAEGYFKQDIKLTSGLNVIEITARNKAEKETKKTIQILAKY